MAEVCASCGETLKLGMLSSNQRWTGSMLNLVNVAQGTTLEAACDRCGGALFTESQSKLKNEAKSLRSSIAAACAHIPIASIHSPVGWEYEVIDILTAQSVTGTGMFSDVTSAFTDLVGAQSGTYNTKLREGENLCKASLRAQALQAGGNAVLAADVDYSEVGGQRAMLMVCMTGTVVRLTNLDVVMPQLQNIVEEAARQLTRFKDVDAALGRLNGFN